MTRHYTLPVTGGTHARFYALADEERISSDSLVNLALDAYLSIVAADVPAFSELARSAAGIRELRREIRDGSHYCEIA